MAACQAMTASTAALVQRECWLGGLPVVFTLAPDEVATLAKPRPFSMLLPRQSLLPLVTDAVRQTFAPFGPPMGGEMWFEAEASSTPLRWQIPIGVLFDLLHGAEGDGTHDVLPWRITVHFQSFPADALLRSTLQEAEQVLLNALKESCYLRCGSASPAMTLSPAEQQKLQAALSAVHPRADLAEAHRTYVPVQALIDGAFRNVPLRAFISPTEWRQLPVPPSQPDGTPTTLREALAKLLPRHVSREADDADADADAAGRLGAVTPLVQGVAVPLSTPLPWLWAACSHPDGWLYVSLRLPVEEAVAAT